MGHDWPSLTRAIAAGDTAAFAVFYEHFFDPAYHEARRLTRRDESFCLDVVQDAMIRAIKAMPPLDSPAAVTRWLNLVVRSCAYDALRKAQRDEARAEQRARMPIGERDIVDAEHLAWLRAQIAELDPTSAHLLELRHRFGWTLQRIAASLGMSMTAVHRRLSRTTHDLKARAHDTFSEDEA
ncbi:MAG: sigma-70 family RNA polymerase sigma factor [Phycisphaerales bacterium]|nr:sigma-70 family RNA polymerase sigma factor [Phycisphaerales bacterium]